jgi:hypothetical protein
MVVAAQPGSELSVTRELDLVKAALLYGDKVTVISPVTTMLLRMEGLQRFTSSQQVELMRRLAPVLLPPDDVMTFEEGMEQAARLLRSRAGDQEFLRAGLRQLLAPGQHELSKMVRDLSGRSGIGQLARARAEGLVRIESADPGDEMDLVISCIVSAKLAQEGGQQDSPHTTRVVGTFVDKLARHLSAGREYLMFDEAVAGLTDAAIREGLFRPAEGPSGRCAQAMTASGLMARLPTFPGSTVDEVLDIRDEMAPPLTQFRAAMVTVSSSFTGKAWEPGFEDELHDAWTQTVRPAVEAIEESVRENRSLLTLAAGTASAGAAALPGLGLLAAGFQGHAGVATAAGGALSASLPLLKALRDRRAQATDIRMKPFYFLYAVGHSLA